MKNSELKNVIKNRTSYYFDYIKNKISLDEKSN